MIVSPHEALVALLRKSGIAGIDWSQQPYYMQVPEPAGGFPFVTYSIEGKGTELTFEAPFINEYTVELWVFAANPQVFALASEFGSTMGSVFAYLDQFMARPDQFNGDTFNGVAWLREGPIDYSRTEWRAPDTSWVWMAHGKYKLSITGNAN